MPVIQHGEIIMVIAPLAVLAIFAIGLADNARMAQTYDLSKCTYTNVSKGDGNRGAPSSNRVCEVKK
jgi:hypothetical protein